MRNRNQVWGARSSEPSGQLLPRLKEAEATRGQGQLCVFGGTKPGCATRLMCLEIRRLEEETPGKRKDPGQERDMGHRVSSLRHTCCPEEKFSVPAPHIHSFS